MSIYSAVITLILIMDPFGNIPVFLSELEGFEPRRRRRIIMREGFFAFIVLIIFLFFGKYILQGLNISQPALGMSGGIILFLIAIRMIFPGREKQRTSDESGSSNSESTVHIEEPLIVPLAVPMMAGPSAMAFVILSSSQYPEHLFKLFIAVLASSVFSIIILTLSDFLRRLLGNQVIRAIERLMGMILTTMAIQMFLTGLTDFFNL